MADLLQRDDTKQKAIKVELPDGTTGELPIHDAATRTAIIKGYGVDAYDKGGEVEEKISPTLKEAQLHKAGLKKSKKIEEGIKKHPKLYANYKPFKKK